MTYYKIINGQRKFCHENGTIRMPDGTWKARPTQEEFIAAGWTLETPPERTLAVAKQEKTRALEEYDQSSGILSFSLNGVDMWLNPTERTNYLMTVNAAENMGLTTVPFHGVNISTTDAKNMLNAIALYAMQVMAVTDAHRDAIEALTTIADVDAYDYTAGYPTKLSF